MAPGIKKRTFSSEKMDWLSKKFDYRIKRIRVIKKRFPLCTADVDVDIHDYKTPKATCPKATDTHLLLHTVFLHECCVVVWSGTGSGNERKFLLIS